MAETSRPAKRTTALSLVRSRLRRLYFGSDRQSRVFRLSMLAVEVLLLLYFVFGSFHWQSPWHATTDLIIATFLLLEWLLRLWLYDLRRSFFSQVSTWLDLLVILSMVAPLLNDSFLFLRVLRFVRLFHSYHVLRDLREMSPVFRRHEEVIDAAFMLAVFIFAMSSIVFVFQVRTNPGINNYVDALYFTVTTLTTTGFGDIVMRDTGGRLLAVAIMVAGFGLFLRLVQATFRPSGRRVTCPDCGLSRHDRDAIHCKHCGRVINIPNVGHD
jgi:voltage-gated potassium channel